MDVTTSRVVNDTDASATNAAKMPEAAEKDLFLFVLNSIAIPVVFGLITLIGLTGNSLVSYIH